MGIKQCVVSYTDVEGVRHGVEVEAESLNEAVALAAHRFAENGHYPSLVTEMRIEERPPAIIHTTTLGRAHEWIETSPKNPRETILKKRLRELLAKVKTSQTQFLSREKKERYH